MTAGQFWLLVIILALIVGFLAVPWLAARRRAEKAWDPAGLYLGAIHALIRGRRREALEALQGLARMETENLLAYLRLGDLVRTMGHPEKAERIHSSLLARPVEDPRLALDVRESLLEDLADLGRWDDVIRQGEKILQTDRKSKVTLGCLTRAHEAREEWDQAFERLDEWSRLEDGKVTPHPSQLRVHVALRRLQEDRRKEARRLLEEAIKLDAASLPARILLGDVLAREGEHEKAIEIWLEASRGNPDQAGVVFERLEKSFFELGRFGELLQIYEKMAQAHPSSSPVILALADMHRRRGRLDEAIQLLESLQATQPRNLAARRLLVSCLLQNRRAEAAAREVEQILRQFPPGRGWACASCGFEELDLAPKCPRCGSWQPVASFR